MKRVLACEGPIEVQLIFKLMEDGLLLFDEKDILDGRPIHLRQPKAIAPLVDILPIDEEIVFYRIGDTQREEFDISCFEAREGKIKVVKVCTKPEVEILAIINEGLYKEYLKVSSEMSPKEFVKANIQKIAAFKEYVSTNDLSSAIKEYKRVKKHEKDELYLADLLK